MIRKPPTPEEVEAVRKRADRYISRTGALPKGPSAKSLSNRARANKALDVLETVLGKINRAAKPIAQLREIANVDI